MRASLAVMPSLRQLVFVLVGVAVLACHHPGGREGRIFEQRDRNSGRENYSAWYADARDGVLYFGLSPFWELWWRHDGDPRVDLHEVGDHLMGRFDMKRDRFLEPLLLRGKGSGARSSVWDVLAHSNGRVYFTTYFEEFGYVEPMSGDVHLFKDIGTGFNELTEGPNGNVYVTRYSDSPADVSKQTYAGVLELTPDGQVVQEVRFDQVLGVFTAVKSVAVDPKSKDIWLNTDTFLPDGTLRFESIRLAADGTTLSRHSAPPELLFVAFDAWGRGYFVEDGPELQIRITMEGREVGRIKLDARDPLDFAQDVKVNAQGQVVVTFWSGRIVLVFPTGNDFHYSEFNLETPKDCPTTAGRFLFYTGVIEGDSLYVTVFCGVKVQRERISFSVKTWSKVLHP